MNITPTSLTITQLLGSQNEQYVIPAYQRRYSWRKHQVRDLWDDIAVLEGENTHLLGTIVCLTGQHTAGLNRLELVDGQQRLITLCILLHCLMERLRNDGKDGDAQDIERLLRAKPPKGKIEPKVALDSLDSDQFDQHTSGSEPSEIENEHLAAAFDNLQDWIRDESAEEVADMAYKVMNQAVIIRLDVSDAKDAFKLFETINNRGLGLSSTDVIKNFMLGNAARFGEKALNGAKRKWAELIRNLDGISTDNFFRHFIMAHLQTPVTRKLVVEEFQSAFMREVKEAEQLPDRERYYDVDTELDEEDDDDDTDDGAVVSDEPNGDEDRSKGRVTRVSFGTFVNRLVASSQAYREIVRAKTGEPKLDRRLRNLRLIKAQPSYGFLMALRVNGCSDKHFEQILKLTESFMLRRHICRERTNENDRVFSRLAGVDAKDALGDVRTLYREYCPSDEKFQEEFAAAKYTPSLIERARYCLEQIEMHLHGDHTELLPGGPADVQVEHIVPQKIRGKSVQRRIGDWLTYLGKGSEDRHPRYVGRIGNLTLFAGDLNLEASNNPYARKKKAYKSSAIKLTKSLPVEYRNFRFAQVEKRSKALAEVAVKLWPVA